MEILTSTPPMLDHQRKANGEVIGPLLERRVSWRAGIEAGK